MTECFGLELRQIERYKNLDFSIQVQTKNALVKSTGLKKHLDCVFGVNTVLNERATAANSLDKFCFKIS